MGTWVPQHEYEAIVASWRRSPRGKPERWTNGQMVAACLANVDEAARREAKLRGFDDHLGLGGWPIGDERRNGNADTPSLHERIRAAVSDQRHWRRELAFWRGRCVAEGDAAYPPGSFEDAQKRAGEPRPVRPARAAEPDPRLPRESEAQVRLVVLEGGREVGADDLPF
jgi:hypothetical protein